MSETVTLARDCDAIQIPYGTKVTLRAGDEVTIVQQLGDTFTVRTAYGFLLRIEAADGDAIGKIPDANSTHSAAAKVPGPLEDTELWDILRSCYDPEIPTNIVELGLIYDVAHSPLPNGLHTVSVTMTLTAPGCGMGQVLKDDVERKIGALPQVGEVDVALVFDPPWDASMMSESARLQLGMM